jgi:hypothetical protein
MEFEPPFGSGVSGDALCADFSRSIEGPDKSGRYWRIGNPDLNAMGPYWMEFEAPAGSGVPTDCLDCP